MADKKHDEPSSHTAPPEAGSNVAPPAHSQRLDPASDEATAELTRAINDREGQDDDDESPEPDTHPCSRCGSVMLMDAATCPGCGMVYRA